MSRKLKRNTNCVSNVPSAMVAREFERRALTLVDKKRNVCQRNRGEKREDYYKTGGTWFVETGTRYFSRNDASDPKRTTDQLCFFSPLRESLNGTIVTLISCVAHVIHSNLKKTNKKKHVAVLEIGTPWREEQSIATLILDITRCVCSISLSI